MDSVRVTLSDGQSVEVRRGSRIDELASSLNIDGNIIAAKLNGYPVDLSRALDQDCSLEWVPMDSVDGLDVLRHSTAHLMAQAVQSLFPGTQVTIGPTIEDGFYYDFKREIPFTPEEIAKDRTAHGRTGQSQPESNSRGNAKGPGHRDVSAHGRRLQSLDHRRHRRGSGFALSPG